MVQIDWLLALAVACEAAGLIQWAKDWLKAAPSWVWRVALPPLCVAIALMPPLFHAGLLAVALAQLGYEKLIKGVAARAGLPQS